MNGAVAGQKRKATDSGSYASATGSHVVDNDTKPPPISNVSVPPHGGSPASSLKTNPMYRKFEKLGVEQVQQEFHRLAFQFANNNNVSQMAMTRPERPEFRELMEFTIFHAATLKKNMPKIVMGWEKFTRLRCSEYELLLGAVAFYATEARDFFKSKANKHVPFVSVGHDVWDSKKKDVLGVTVFFYNPVRDLYVIAPIGLAQVTSKGAVDTAAATLEILNRAGLEKPDLYRAVNDNAGTAKATSRFVVGLEGSCLMHKISLVIDHATGAKTRSCGKQVTDEFKQCEEFRKKCKTAAKTVMNKKSKGKFAAYRSAMEKSGRKARVIVMPNSTRAAGHHIFYSSLLGSCWNLDQWWHQTDEAGVLTNKEFIVLADLESVLYPVSLLSKQVQTNNFGSIAYSFLYVFRTFVAYGVSKHWWVANCDKSSLVDAEHRWHASAKFPKRSYKGVPIGELTPSLETITYRRKKRDQLEWMADRLLQRLIKEFVQYCAQPDTNQLLAMGCNPLTATLGFSELEAQATFLEKMAIDNDVKEFASDFRQLSSQALEKELRVIFSEALPQQTTAGNTNVSAPSSENDEDEDMLAGIRKEQQEKRHESSKYGANDPLMVEIGQFFDQQINWLQLLKTNNVPEEVQQQVGTTTEAWQQNWELIAEHFDCMKWWENHGKEQFPHLYILACLILALPESNGHQERTFSAATWMDGNLSSKQSNATFEMKILIAKNKTFLDRARKDLKSHHEKQASKATKDLLAVVAKHKTKEQASDDNSDSGFEDPDDEMEIGETDEAMAQVLEKED